MKFTAIGTWNELYSFLHSTDSEIWFNSRHVIAHLEWVSLQKSKSIICLDMIKFWSIYNCQKSSVLLSWFYFVQNL